MNKNIVTIGGGTGTYVVLMALKNFDFNLSAVVSMCDDGGSTGQLRDDYGELPPGDIRRSLIALSAASRNLRRLFDYRFKDGSLDGHNFGNLFLTALEKWPEYDEKYLQEEMVDLVVQINGKTRDVLKVKRDMEEEKVKAVALASEKIKRHFRILAKK